MLQLSLNITTLLHDWQTGNESALQQLVHVVSQMLHRQAVQHMRDERPNHTLQATALVNEAFIDLLQTNIHFVDRLHFFRIASRIMRRILVNHARKHNALKRGAGKANVSLTETPADPASRHELLALDRAMQALADFDAYKAELIELHFFAGLTHQEIAVLYDVSTKTIERHSRVAKAWLSQAL